MTEPTPAAGPTLGPSGTGLDPKIAATLSYLGWWVTGVIVFVLERENRYVRFHALQAILAFGALSVVGSFLVLASIITLFVSSEGFQALMLAAQLVLVAWLVAWVICLTKAYGGERWKLPLVGPIAERIAGR